MYVCHQGNKRSIKLQSRQTLKANTYKDEEKLKLLVVQILQMFLYLTLFRKLVLCEIQVRRFINFIKRSNIYKQMAQNRFIRPLSTRYHDITEQRIQQRFEDIPFKFRSQFQPDFYVKKPQLNHQFINPLPPQPIVYEPQPTCWEQFCNLFSCRRSQLPSFSQPTCCTCFQSDPLTRHKKPGACCIRSFQPELCDQCIEKLCRQCENTLCLKLRMCQVCKNKMCLNCRKSLCCVSSLRIKNSYIQFRNKNTLHFQSCQCAQCLKFNASHPNNLVNNIIQNQRHDSLGDIVQMARQNSLGNNINQNQSSFVNDVLQIGRQNSHGSNINLNQNSFVNDVLNTGRHDSLGADIVHLTRQNSIPQNKPMGQNFNMMQESSVVNYPNGPNNNTFSVPQNQIPPIQQRSQFNIE